MRLIAGLCLVGADELLVLAIAKRLSYLVVKDFIDLCEQFADVKADIVGSDSSLIEEAREDDTAKEFNDADCFGPAG